MRACPCVYGCVCARACGCVAARVTSDALAFLTGREALLLRSRFEAWLTHVQSERARRAGLMRAVVVRVRQRLVAMCLESWKDFHADVGKVKHAARRWASGALHSAWAKWDEFTYVQRRPPCCLLAISRMHNLPHAQSPAITTCAYACGTDASPSALASMYVHAYAHAGTSASG